MSEKATRLLDLFCGAGGAAMGYSQAGFTEIVGVDIEPQPNYPFDVLQMDASQALEMWMDAGIDYFDLIHASPPCQAFSVATPHGLKSSHPDLIGPTRELLEASGVPYVIENVPSAPLRPDLKLCGSMFGLQIQRHRVFEYEGFFVWNPPVCRHEWENGRPHTVAGHADGDALDRPHSLGFRDTEHAKELMGMPWCAETSEVVEAIPPPYTRFIGEAILSEVLTSA